MRPIVVLMAAAAFIGVACQEPTASSPSDAAVLEEGERAPTFSLEGPQGEISLAEYRGEKPVLLYFSMGPG